MGLHTQDFPAEMPHQIHVMHKVNGNRSGPFQFAPLCDLKIIIGFVKPTSGLQSTNLPEAAFAYQRFCFFNDRIMAAVMTDQDSNVFFFRTLHQMTGFFYGGSQWFFNKNRDTILNACFALLHMKMSGRRYHDPIRRFFFEHFR